uniref:Noggin 2 n=1 Tax=Schmidtea mediterranea TaxID=79327 RepID=C1JAC1_SCHMD|nr:noggin 2 [Schmidtea mediterranea]
MKIFPATNRVYVVILFLGIIAAQISLNDRDNVSQSLWVQFQKRNVAKYRDQTEKKPFASYSRNSLESLLKPNYKPKFPFFFPNFKTEEIARAAFKLTNGQLLKLLNRKNFNSNFMSITEPESSNDIKQFYISKSLNLIEKQNQKSFLRKALQLFHLKKFRKTINRDFRRKLRTFLDLFSWCPVTYQWKDMGPKFWPRWIKQGSCANLSKSCSYPEGLVCQEYEHKNIAVLRFLCMSDWAIDKCKWYKIYIPFLLTCRCGCNR